MSSKSKIERETFSFAKVENFDDHINNSIRGYSDLISDVVSMSQYFLESDTKMIDIGCSTGRMLNDIELNNRDIIKNVKYIGIENEPNMIDKQFNNPAINYFNKDIREFDDWQNTSLVTSIFTLQFINRNMRIPIVKQIFLNLNDGGAFIFAEKVYSQHSRIQDMMTFMFYDYKRQHFSDTEILDKEKSLRHMLRPCTDDGLVGLHSIVQRAGFSKIEPFWRNHNFVGYIAIK